MKKFFNIPSNLLIFPLVLAPLVLTGCSHQSTLSQTATKVEEKAQQASNASKDAATGTLANVAKEAVDNAVQDAKDSASAQVNRASEAAKEVTATPDRIAMSASRFIFSPSTLTVKKGRPVELSITATDATHGFSLPAFGINETIEPGRTTVVKFTPDKAGEFPFACSVICGVSHSEMKGKLVVTE